MPPQPPVFLELLCVFYENHNNIFLNGEIIQILNLEISWCLYEVVHPTLFESASSPLVCS